MSILQSRFHGGRKLGEMFDAERRNGIEIETRGDLVSLHIWKDGVRFDTIEAPPDRAEQIAELLHEGARHIRGWPLQWADPQPAPELSFDPNGVERIPD